MNLHIDISTISFVKCGSVANKDVISHRQQEMILKLGRHLFMPEAVQYCKTVNKHQIALVPHDIKKSYVSSRYKFVITFLIFIVLRNPVYGYYIIKLQFHWNYFSALLFQYSTQTEYSTYTYRWRIIISKILIKTV